MNKKLIFLVLILSFGARLFAQTEKRIEFPVALNKDNHDVINLGQNGILVVNKIDNDDAILLRFDSNLNKVWDINTKIPNKYIFSEYVVDGEFVYLLFSGKSLSEFMIMKLSMNFAAIQSFPINGLQNFNLTNFHVKNDQIAIAGIVKNEPVILLNKFGNSTPRIITSSIKGNISLQSITMLDASLTAVFVHNYKKRSNVIVRNYSFLGKAEYTKMIEPTKDKEFLTAKFFNTNNSSLIVGNYGIGLRNRDGSSSSQGIFVSKYQVNGEFETKYFSFTEFNNFFSFLNKKELERVEKQINKSKKKGGEYKTNYRLYINDLVASGDGFMLVGEVFVPEFRSTNPYSNSMFGNPLFYPTSYWSRSYLYNSFWNYNPWLYGYRNSNSQILDGFRYLSGIIVNINKTGEIVNDNSVPYKNLKKYNLEPMLKVNQNAEFVTAAYALEGKVYLNRFSSDTTAKVSNVYNSMPVSSPDFVKSTVEEETSYWHDNYFLGWGTQKILDEAGKRKNVFFVNKIRY